MKEKCFALLACTLFMLSFLGLGYAQWDDAVMVSSTMTFGTVDIAFVYPLNCTDHHEDPLTGLILPGEYRGKDVGICSAFYDSEVDSLDAYRDLYVTLSNAYPGYIVHCYFSLVNIGTLDALIEDILVIDPDGVLTWDAVERALVDDFGDPIIYIGFDPEIVSTILTTTEPNNKKEFTLSISITQNAKEFLIYRFQINPVVEEAP